MGTDADSLRTLTTRATTLLAELAAAVAEIQAVAAEVPAVDPPAAVSRSLLTVGQAAEALGLSRSAVYTLIGSGSLGSVRIGSRRRIPAAAVDAYVAALGGVA
jgi:excisionase family DNA binding protein